MITRCVVAVAMAGGVISAVGCGCGGTVTEAVHDQAFNDNHPWNAREAFVFRRYWADEHGGAYRPYQKLPRHDQDEYWNWRHSHPD